MEPSFWPQTFTDWLFVLGYFASTIAASVTLAWAFVKDKLNGYGDRLNEAEREVTKNTEAISGARDRLTQVEFDAKKLHEAFGRLETMISRIESAISNSARSYERDARRTLERLAAIETTLRKGP